MRAFFTAMCCGMCAALAMGVSPPNTAAAEAFLDGIAKTAMLTAAVKAEIGPALAALAAVPSTSEGQLAVLQELRPLEDDYKLVQQVRASTLTMSQGYG